MPSGWVTCPGGDPHACGTTRPVSLQPPRPAPGTRNVEAAGIGHGQVGGLPAPCLGLPWLAMGQGTDTHIPYQRSIKILLLISRLAIKLSEVITVGGAIGHWQWSAGYVVQSRAVVGSSLIPFFPCPPPLLLPSPRPSPLSLLPSSTSAPRPPTARARLTYCSPWQNELLFMM